MPQLSKSAPVHYRTLWISDLHLGSKGCHAEYLCDFLNRIKCEQLYLVGDIIDLWAMEKNIYWPQSHNEVVQTILKLARQGIKVSYIPGNHDAPLRLHEGTAMGNVMIRNEVIHQTADGRRLLVIHGDQFDKVVTCSRIQEILGNHAYDFLIWLNRTVNRLRRTFNRPYWSLAAYLKTRVKNAVAHIRRFEYAAAYEAQRRGLDGVVCGHLHHSELRYIDGVLYSNTGDWVESCTALVEESDGTMKIVHWTEQQHTIKDLPLISKHPLQDAA